MPGPPPATVIRRRWLSFRLSTLLLVVTAAAVAFGFPHLRRQYYFQRLKGYAGQDMFELPEQQYAELRRIVNILVKKSSRNPFRMNWLFWQLKTDRGTRYVLLQRHLNLTLPGESTTYIHLFDPFGRIVGDWTFPTGWCLWQQGAAPITDKTFGAPMIRIDTTPAGLAGIDPESMARHQYYSLRGDELVLIRLEDGHGKCIPNDFSKHSVRIGPAIARRTDREWIEFLSSPNTVQSSMTMD